MLSPSELLRQPWIPLDPASSNMAEQDEEESVVADCTCNMCVDGWLSPRMKERLESEADSLQYASLQLIDDLHDDSDFFDLSLQDGILSESFIAADEALHYIPYTMHEKMNPLFYNGYVAVIQCILRIFLRDPTGTSLPIPTLEAVADFINNIDEAAKKATEDGDVESKAPLQSEIIHFYLDNDGKIEYALDAITHLAYDKSPIGGSYDRNKDIREENAELEKAFEDAELPRCQNDLNFKLVRTKLGLPATSKGPSWFFLTDLSEYDDMDNEELEGEEAVYEGVHAEKNGEEDEGEENTAGIQDEKNSTEHQMVEETIEDK